MSAPSLEQQSFQLRHRRRLEELRSMTDGWHDHGDGIAPKNFPLIWVEDWLATLTFEDSFPLHLFPTLEGGISIEVQGPTVSWSLEVSPRAELVIVVVGGPYDGYFEPSTGLEARDSLMRCFADFEA